MLQYAYAKTKCGLSLSSEYIVVFPYSSNVICDDKKLKAILSILTKMSVDASVAYWKQNRGSKLILIGETCYSPSLPNTAELMKEYVKKAKIPEKSLVLLDNDNGKFLNNTPLQAAGLANFLKSEVPATMTVIGLRYHLSRVETHLKAFGVNAEYMAAEDILADTGLIQDYKKYLPYLAKAERSEKWLRRLALVDRKGRITNIGTRLKGPRVVDIVSAPDGKLHFINTFSRLRQTELQKKLN